MKRRGNREGSIRKLKDGKGFRGAVSLGVDAAGKPIRKYIKRQRYDEVVKEIKKLVEKVGLNQPVKGRGGETVERFLTDWLEHWVKPNRAASTYVSWEYHVRVHINPDLGKIQLDKLSVQDVQRMLSSLASITKEKRLLVAKNGGKMGRRLKDKLGSGSIRIALGVLKAALTRAVKSGKLSSNPALHAEAPKYRRVYESRSLTFDEAAALLAAVEGDRYEVIHTFAALGLRKGEILGMKWTDFMWTDISHTAAVFTISRALSRVTGKGVFLGDTKTTNSRRSIDVPQFAVEALKRRYLIQQQERADAGDEWQDTGLIITGRDGLPFGPEEVRRVHHKALKKANVAPCRFHDLRHTTATLLLAKKVPMKMVSSILGHSNFSFTMQVYGHVLDPMRREASDVLDQIYQKQLPSPNGAPPAPMTPVAFLTTLANGKVIEPQPKRKKLVKAA